MNLIKQLQEEDKLALRKRIADEKEEQNNIICTICLEALMEDEIIPLENCDHIFHLNCLSSYLQSQIDQRKFPLVCPQFKCGKQVIIENINGIVSQEYLDKFYNYTLQSYINVNAETVSCCPTADCQYAFVFDEEDHAFKCPVCNLK